MFECSGQKWVENDTKMEKKFERKLEKNILRKSV